MRNPHVIPHMIPSLRADRALRWIRSALTLENPEDQFLSFYIALEAISRDIKDDIQTTHTCAKCGASTGISRSAGAGIRELIARHPEFPKDTFRQLSSTRAKIAHGETGSRVRDRLSRLLPLVQRLAVEGVALALGANPTRVGYLQALAPEILLKADFKFNPEDNPHTRWGGAFLAVYSKFREKSAESGK